MECAQGTIQEMGAGTLHRQGCRVQQRLVTDVRRENHSDGQCPRDHIRTHHPNHQNLDPVTLLEALRAEPEECDVLLHTTAGLL